MKNFKVPSTTDVNQPCDNKVVVNKVMTAFSKWFGGWVSNSGALVVENVTPESFGEMKQEAVTLEYNEQVKFV